MKELPDYMKPCFRMDLFLKRYIVEAPWYHGGYQPTLEEHLRNGFVSSAGPIVGLYSYICSADPIKEDVMEFIVELPDIARLAYEIFRLSDDYGTGSVLI